MTLGDESLPAPAETWSELPALEGELTIYSGRTRDQIDPIFTALEEEYDAFTIRRDYDDNATQLTKIREETPQTRPDVFYTQSSGALAAMKTDELTVELPTEVVETLPTSYRDPDGEWIGISGRVRAIQYNTDVFSPEELPTDIFAYEDDSRFEGRISTRPNSGTFRSFIIAMLELEGEDRTREWIRSMLDKQDITMYASGAQQAQAVADGSVAVGLGNQYYAARVLSNDPEASIGVTFTNDDPGSLFNVSGVAIPRGADNPELAVQFIRHLLAVEGQEFFVETNGEYPVRDGVEYVGDLPALSELNPPEFDLNALADVERAVDVLREEGMTV